jgi:hypothetical protein
LHKADLLIWLLICTYVYTYVCTYICIQSTSLPTLAVAYVLPRVGQEYERAPVSKPAEMIATYQYLSNLNQRERHEIHPDPLQSKPVLSRAKYFSSSRSHVRVTHHAFIRRPTSAKKIALTECPTTNVQSPSKNVVLNAGIEPVLPPTQQFGYAYHC